MEHTKDAGLTARPSLTRADVPSYADWLPFPRSPIFPTRSWGDWRDIENNVAAIRRYLVENGYIEFKCFNKIEMEETAAKLTEDERKRVRFFWMEP